MTRTMQVTETCQQLGIAESTLKRWTERGLITASRHPINNSRQYDVAEVARVKVKLASVIETADLTTAFKALTISRGLTFADDLTEASATAAEPKFKLFTPADVAGQLGISLDLLTTWTDRKFVATVSDPHGVPMIASDELDRVKKALDANQKSKDLGAVVKAPGRSQL
jgi:transposase-like protein